MRVIDVILGSAMLAGVAALMFCWLSIIMLF